ncbi:hypothetical protein GCM10010389_09800 [Streptomyces echinoruber]|uniref:Uncharacterized protein n=1 Tax=Streptomyces echinoruber TaxID=68898 RepID=A0A918QV61_9ACTN|nr:hypothetical protein GCM10010389_09800 [Streptomyces echinoruber]
MARARLRIGLLVLALPAVPVPAAGTALAPTAEERRLDGPVPREILRRSGFDAMAAQCARELERVRSYARARRVVERRGAALWRRSCSRCAGGTSRRGRWSGRCGRTCRRSTRS